ncbi:MAG: hypothetical protein IPP67_00265 [Rhodospirillaceae bacterium]|nr:hypothetical protein [Rhodospirillaceae bacterium]
MLQRQDLAVYLIVHPVLLVKRRAGQRQKMGEDRGESLPESFMQIRISEQTSPERMAETQQPSLTF